MTDELTDLYNRDTIEDFLFHVLRTFYQFERIEVSKFDLSFDLIYILKCLRRMTSIRISDLADEMKIQVFTATRHIDQLEKKGLVQRNRDKADKRNILVSITARGKAMVKKIESHAFGLVAENMTDYSTEDVLLLINTVRKIDSMLGIKPSDYLDLKI